MRNGRVGGEVERWEMLEKFTEKLEEEIRI